MPSLLESTANTRQVLPGSFRYLRSDAPLSPTERDVGFLMEHGVNTLIDLRSDAEVQHRPCPLANDARFTYRHMPVTGGNAMPSSVEDVSRSYLRMVDEQLARILRTIKEADTGVMFFCTAGKDRTGVVSALLQRQAGLLRESIVADYVQSGENLQDMFAGFLLTHPDIDVAIYTPAPKYMEQFLDMMDNDLQLSTEKGAPC